MESKKSILDFSWISNKVFDFNKTKPGVFHVSSNLSCSLRFMYEYMD